MFTPVQPGVRMRPNMTAEWFNQTLPKTANGKLNTPKSKQLPPGTLECVLDGGTPNRFDPVGLDSIVTNNDIDYVPRVSVSGLDADNWGVVQAGSTGTIDVCFWGLCLATVTEVEAGQNLVTYSTANSRLETSDTGKAQLLWYNATGPSFISIGTPGGSGGGGGGGETITLYRFTLTSDMILDGSMEFYIANADIKTMGGTAVESTTVSDQEGIFSTLTSGTPGYCLLQEGVYYVIQADCPV